MALQSHQTHLFFRPKSHLGLCYNILNLKIASPKCLISYFMHKQTLHTRRVQGVLNKLHQIGLLGTNGSGQLGDLDIGIYKEFKDKSSTLSSFTCGSLAS